MALMSLVASAAVCRYIEFLLELFSNYRLCVTAVKHSSSEHRICLDKISLLNLIISIPNAIISGLKMYLI